MIDRKIRVAIRRRLLTWFASNQRDLPWRKRKTPYRIWVSEIMLQQTQVATVIDYFENFINRFPNVQQLAKADQSEVLKYWEGLGYYRRARQMHQAAQIIVEQHGCRFPTHYPDLLSLPGIGRYTAAAILSIACDQQLPILEGNTIRLFARLTGMKSDPRSSANLKALWQTSESLVPRSDPGDFNQALMELGATVCKPRRPNCNACPIKQYCAARIKGLQTKIPAPTRKLKYESIQEAVVLVRRSAKYLVRQCGEQERWTGLWDFPRYALDAGDQASKLADQLRRRTGLTASVERDPLTIRHAVTRFRITLDCYEATGISGRINRRIDPSLSWKTLAEINELPMSVTGRKIADHLQKKKVVGQDAGPVGRSRTH